MKKVTKGFIIGACICIALGSVFCIGAAAAGGVRATRFLAENGRLSIGPDGVSVEYSGNGNPESGHRGNGNRESQGSGNKVAGQSENGSANSQGQPENGNMATGSLENRNFATEYVVSLTNRGKIDLDLELGAGEFEMIETDTPDMVIRSNEKIDINEYGDTVEIYTMQKIWDLDFEDCHNEITIEVPKGTVFDSVSMEVGAGQLNAPIIRCRSLDVEVGAGSVSVGEFVCTEASLSVEAGELLIEKGNTRELDVDAAMGYLEFNGSVEGYLEAECDMGEILLQLTASEQDYNYQVECGMGTVNIGEKAYSGMGMQQNINNGALRDCGIECDMGSVQVYFEK